MGKKITSKKTIKTTTEEIIDSVQSEAAGETNSCSEDKDRKNTLLEIRSYSEEQFDKLIVTFNGGALTISMGFVKNIVKISEASHIFLLKLSWFCFILSLLFILLSHKSSVWSMDLELVGKDTKSDSVDRVTKIINWCSMSLLIIGIATFTIFVSINLA